MTAPLYELAATYAAIQQAAEDGEDCTDALAAINDDLVVKARNIGAIFRNFDADDAALTAEVARLDAKLNAVRSAKRRLADNVLRHMEAANIERIAAPGFAMWRAPAEHVEVDDIDAVPSEYLRDPKPAKKEAAKKAILDAYKRNGECVDGTRVVKTYHLRIG